MSTTLLLFVFLLGVHVTVTVFAAPPQPTLTLSIYQSVRGSTLSAPFGAAQAVVLLVSACLCLWASHYLAKRSQSRSRRSLAACNMACCLIVLLLPVLMVCGSALNGGRTMLFPPRDPTPQCFADFFIHE